MSTSRDPDWDSHCFQFAADHIRQATGRDVWAEFNMACPHSPRETADVLRKLKTRTLKGAAAKVLGKPVDPKLAMRGDIVMVDNALGICRGDLVELMDGMQPLHRAECAWKLPR